MEEKRERHLKPLTMKLSHAAFELSRALAQQRDTDRPELDRKAYEIGLLFVAMEGAADEEGMYGILTGERLAQLLRPHCLPLIEFLERYGQLPVVLHSLLGNQAAVSAHNEHSEQADEPGSSIAADPTMFKGYTSI